MAKKKKKSRKSIPAKVYAWLGVAATLIGIFVFITGKNLPDLLPQPSPSPSDELPIDPNSAPASPSASDPAFEPSPSSSPAPIPPVVENLTISASYTYASFYNVDAIITAQTNINAVRVEMSWANMGGDSSVDSMTSFDGRSWVFYADFYEIGTFEITITAYSSDGQTASTVISIPYP